MEQIRMASVECNIKFRCRCYLALRLEMDLKSKSVWSLSLYAQPPQMVWGKAEGRGNSLITRVKKQLLKKINIEVYIAISVD